MTRWSYLILVVYIVLAVNAQGKLEDDTTTKEPPSTITTKETTTKPTTTSTSTTTSSTSTSTTTQKTSTTTETTTAPPTPKPTPTPTPTPAAPKKYPKNIGHWLLNETSTSNVSCLALDAAFELKLPNVTTPVDVPLDANITGKCGEMEITASLTWMTGNDSNVLMLTFGKKGSNFLLKDVSVSLPGQDVSGKLENVTLYETPLNRTYKCVSESPVKLSNQVELKVASMRVEPFRSSPFTGYSKEYECSSDDVSTVVPFAVGISLALLVVIVLVAYLIGRRRSRARGYQSV